VSRYGHPRISDFGSVLSNPAVLDSVRLPVSVGFSHHRRESKSPRGLLRG